MAPLYPFTWSTFALTLSLLAHGTQAYHGTFVVPDFPTEGESFKIPFNIDTPVAEYTREWCDAVGDLENCQYIQDELSILTGQLRAAERGADMKHYYTPTMPSSTMEDFQSSRTTLIQYLQQTFKFQDYLEIGCGDNQSFLELSGSKIFRKAECVDPTRGGTHRMTSDAYFSSILEHNRVNNIPNNTSFDIIFVDGLHSADQSYRDVLHSLALIRPGGIVMMHDCNPRQNSFQIPYEELKEDPIGLVWNGDVWKAVVALRALRGLDIEMIVGDFDYGVGVIRFRGGAGSGADPAAAAVAAEDVVKTPLRIADTVATSVKPLYQFLASMSAEEVMSGLRYELLNQYRRDLLNLKSIHEVREWLAESSARVTVGEL